MRRHPELGARILSSREMDDIREWILAHHERPDGQGYPKGLSGGEIPLEASILARRRRLRGDDRRSRLPRRAMGPDRPRGRSCWRCAGSQFDARGRRGAAVAPSTARARRSRRATAPRCAGADRGAHHGRVAQAGRRNAGSSRARMMVASMSTATAVPTANSLMKIRSEKTKAPIATANRSAAAVISRRFAASAAVIASRSLTPWRRCLGDPLEQEDAVVGREPEGDGEQQDRDRRVERLLARVVQRSSKLGRPGRPGRGRRRPRAP